MAERKNPGIPLGCVSDGGAYLPEREKVWELRRAVCENCGKVFYALNEGKKPQRFCCQDCYFEFRYGRRE